MSPEERMDIVRDAKELRHPEPVLICSECKKECSVDDWPWCYDCRCAAEQESAS